MNKWVKIGEIGVDSGLVWLGDPCYILHRENGPPESVGKNWPEFCATLAEPKPKCAPRAKSYNYDFGHEGLGVCVSTAHSDGTYDVMAQLGTHGAILAVKIKFG